MMTVHVYDQVGIHRGAWYPEGDQVQVPRKGDTLWLESDDTRFSRWRVTRVEWAFVNKTVGVSKDRRISVEVHVKQWSTDPLWKRFVMLFPSAA